VKPVGESSVRRLSLYLRFLDDEEGRGRRTISSEALAALAGTTSAQVRKDLSQFGSFGIRGTGYDCAALRGRLREILGLEREWRVIIVGAGKIGAALAQYPGFGDRGFRVVGVYDADPAKIGSRWGQVRVQSPAKLATDVKRLDAQIAVLAVPAAVAQEMLGQVAKAGVRAVLNFAPIPLIAPRGVTVQSVNMAQELEALSYALAHAPAPATKSKRSRGTG
jgi:redox-sensing transcriptional repressor